jgi:putative phosphoesterase
MARLGVVSDIHCNLATFQKALAIFDEHKVEQVLCAGDFVNEGDPHGDEVIELAQTWGVIAVRGNHDQWVIDDENAMHPHPITSKSLQYLVDLPLKRELVYDKFRILLAHANPWNLLTYIFPDSEIHIERVVKLTEQTGNHLVILGHTHIPMIVHYQGVRIINPGSVDRNRYQDSRTCVVLDTDPFIARWYDIDSGKVVRTGT